VYNSVKCGVAALHKLKRDTILKSVLYLFSEFQLINRGKKMNRDIETIKELPASDREFFKKTKDIRELTAASMLSHVKRRNQIEKLKKLITE